MPLARHDGLDEIGVLPQCQTRSHSVRGSKALPSSQAHLRVLKVEHESPEASLVLLRNAAEFLVHPGLAFLTRHAENKRIHAELEHTAPGRARACAITAESESKSRSNASFFATPFLKTSCSF